MIGSDGGKNKVFTSEAGVPTSVSGKPKKEFWPAWMKRKPKPVKVSKQKSSVFGNPDILAIDLIKDQRHVEVDWSRHLRNLGFFLFLTLFLVGDVYLTLVSWEKTEIYNKTKAIQAEVAKVDSQISQVRLAANEAETFKNHLELATSAFNQHVYYSNFFAYLEKNTLANIFYSEFTGDLDGDYVLKSSTDDYRAISYQIKAFSSDADTKTASTTNESVDNLTGDGAEVVGAKFDLNITLNPELFRR